MMIEIDVGDPSNKIQTRHDYFVFSLTSLCRYIIHIFGWFFQQNACILSCVVQIHSKVIGPS